MWSGAHIATSLLDHYPYTILYVLLMILPELQKISLKNEQIQLCFGKVLSSYYDVHKEEAIMD